MRIEIRDRVVFVRTPETLQHHVFGPDRGVVTSISHPVPGLYPGYAWVLWSNGLHSKVPYDTLRLDV